MSNNKTDERKSSVFFNIVLAMLFVFAFAFVWFAGYVYADTSFKQQGETTSVVIAMEPAENILPVEEQVVLDEQAILRDFENLKEKISQIESMANETLLAEQNDAPETVAPEMLDAETPDVKEAVQKETVEVKIIEPEVKKAENESSEETRENVIQKDAEFEVEDFEEVAIDVKPAVFYVAVVIDDMGISPRRTKEMLSVKAPITSSFLTYGNNLKEYLGEAVEAGHEIMVHTPMEPKVQADLAPDTLKISMSDEEIEKNFSDMLAKFEGFKIKGINNHMGSLFTESAQKLDAMMKILKQKNMYFLDSKTSEYSQGENVAKMEGVVYVARDVFLDNDNDYQKVRNQLAKLEKIAEKRGFAVAIGHPKIQTYAALKDWLPTIGEKNIKLVHLSELIDLKNNNFEK